MILLVGGNGYVGTHVKAEFTRMNIQFESVDKDNFNLYTEPQVNKLKNYPNYNAVIFLASIIRCDNETDLIINNLKMLTSFISLFYQNNIKIPLFFLSSLHVYSELKKPCHLENSCVPSRNMYGFSKYVCETFLINSSYRYDFPLWIGRAGNLISTALPMNKMSFISDIHKCIKSKQPVRFNLAAKRDLVDIYDFSKGLLIRINQMTSNFKNIFIENVCSENPFLFLRFMQLLQNEAEKKSIQIEFNTFEKEDYLLGIPYHDRIWGKGPDLKKLAALILSKDIII